MIQESRRKVGTVTAVVVVVREEDVADFLKAERRNSRRAAKAVTITCPPEKSQFEFLRVRRDPSEPNATQGPSLALSTRSNDYGGNTKKSDSTGTKPLHTPTPLYRSCQAHYTPQNQFEVESVYSVAANPTLEFAVSKTE